MKEPADSDLHIDTQLIHADHCDKDSAVSPPITFTATFRADSPENFARIALEPQHPRFYTRYGNPLHQRVAKIIAELEGAESALVTASGMSAISSTLLSFVKQGDHVVAQKNHYMATAKIITEFLPKFGVKATLVDQADAKAFEQAITAETKIIYLETPVNPTLALTDLSAISQIAKKSGILTVCDNTFASPLNQQPIKHGIDIVVHSATKFLGGHHDITAGAIVASKDLVSKIWETLIMLGPTLSPMDAWLLLRGLRTLSLRVQRQNENALKIAKFLEKHPRIKKVFYPGLETHPQHWLAKKQMKGFGGMLAFCFKGNYADTSQFMSALKIPQNAVSLGGVESLAVHAASMWAGSMTEQQMITAHIDPTLIRFSVGIESAEDLISDLNQALSF